MSSANCPDGIKMSLNVFTSWSFRQIFMENMHLFNQPGRGGGLATEDTIRHQTPFFLQKSARILPHFGQIKLAKAHIFVYFFLSEKYLTCTIGHFHTHSNWLIKNNLRGIKHQASLGKCHSASSAPQGATKGKSQTGDWQLAAVNCILSLVIDTCCDDH